ncbi:integrase catalytic subunit [Vibrio scophthalmi LMG 19158]|uniref:Integrase catalytic subunit n=1 Tax=Vibrio scophthalmi LMG 19158 TaxID=870967 RepID=F9RK32_9VIBR|nr:integrase catalytic subunit [Vibrio scophthalmi LMG 19158]
MTETPRTEANAMLMRGALLEWGKPVTCKTDNGSDYVSNRMKQTFISLSIEQTLCTPFHPQEKPHIERVFRTFSHDWLEMMPGYVGHNVAERKGIEARKSFANRLMNKGDIIEAKLSPQDLQTFCDQWLEIYHHREHGALGCSPFVKATSWNGVIDRVSDERALDMLLASPAGNNGRRKIAKKGIKVDGIWYISPELNVGDWVYVYYDESDIGRLVVYNDDHAFLCIAQAPDFTGVSRKELASAAKRKQTQQMQLAHKAAREARSKYNIRDLAEEVMNHELTQARNVAAFPQREVEFTSSTLEAGREAHDALSSIDSPSQGSPLTEAEVRFLEEDIVRIQKEERAKQCEDETEEGRFIRWIELHEKMEAGEELDELNGQWKARYETSSDFKGRKMMFDDWGKAAFVK